MRIFLKNLQQSVQLYLCMTLVLAIFYPLTVTGIALLIAPKKSSGDFLISQEQIIGSRLIGQQFTSNRYFWGRPSATHYNPLPSQGSNLGPTSSILQKQIQNRRTFLATAHQVSEALVPIELLFTSGSGLDPHISPDAAYFQIERVAKARNLHVKKDIKILHEMIDSLIEQPSCGFLGPLRVNVLILNQKIDESLGHE